MSSLFIISPTLLISKSLLEKINSIWSWPSLLLPMDGGLWNIPSLLPSPSLFGKWPLLAEIRLLLENVYLIVRHCPLYKMAIVCNATSWPITPRNATKCAFFDITQCICSKRLRITNNGLIFNIFQLNKIGLKGF